MFQNLARFIKLLWNSQDIEPLSTLTELINARFWIRPSLIFFSFTFAHPLHLASCIDARDKFSDTIIVTTTADFVKANTMQSKANTFL